VVFDRCLPCLTCGASVTDENAEPVAWIWYFISSELLMFSLRITAIVFGIVKVTTSVSRLYEDAFVNTMLLVNVQSVYVTVYGTFDAKFTLQY